MHKPSRGVRGRLLALVETYDPIPLTYTDLTDELGITRNHAHQEVTQLVKRGWLKRERGEAEVLIGLACE